MGILTPNLYRFIVSFMNFKPLLVWIPFGLIFAGCVLPAKETSPEIRHTNTAFQDSQPTTQAVETEIPTQPPTSTPQPSLRIESGDYALFIGDWETALDEYQEAFENSLDSEMEVAALFGKARAWMMGRNYFQAVQELEALILFLS